MRKPIGFTVLILATVILLLSGATPAFADASAQGDYSSAGSYESLIHIGYLSVLNRIDTPTEYVNWWDALQSGAVTRAGFANAIVNSHEKRYKVVLDFYRSFLGREATPPEAEAWANAMDAGMSWQAVRAKLIASTEFANTFGAIANADFITRNYQFMLGRTPQAGEVNAWSAAMGAGMSRETVAYLIALSTENTYPFVNGEYRYFLGRNAGPSEQAMWGNALSAGTIREEDVDVGLVGSAEFFYWWIIFGPPLP